MKRLSMAAAAFALAAAACGGGANSVAASVNGTDITVNEVEALIFSESETIPKEDFARFLGFQIQWQIVEQGSLDEWGIEVGEDEITSEADRIYQEAGGGETREDFTSSRGVTEQFLREVAHQGLLDTAVREQLRDELEAPSQAEIDEATPGLTEVCVTHILVQTAEEAQAAVGRIGAGEDIGAIAAEISLDTGSATNNGVLPCGQAAGYVAEFRDASLIAPIGQVHDEVVETQFGFHILLVTERTPPTEEAVVESLATDAVTAALNTWFQDRLQAAEVVVTERFGTWQTTPQPGVIPPSE